MPTKKTVFVIDDDPDLLEVAKTVLSGAGFSVLVASTGRDGLARIRKGGIDCIILDVMLETETEGFHIAQDLRADPKTAGIPIVMLTSVSKRTGFEFSPETDKDYMSVEAFLEKPVDPKRLVQAVRDLMK
jgi:CheY-like chemotaxis protein